LPFGGITEENVRLRHEMTPEPDERGTGMARKSGQHAALNWEMLLGLVATGFILYVWVWAATQGGPPW
jgi:hypothetical protein